MPHGPCPVVPSCNFLAQVCISAPISESVQKIFRGEPMHVFISRHLSEICLLASHACCGSCWLLACKCLTLPCPVLAACKALVPDHESLVSWPLPPQPCAVIAGTRDFEWFNPECWIAKMLHALPGALSSPNGSVLLVLFSIDS